MESIVALNNCIKECEELIRMLNEDCEVDKSFFDGNLRKAYEREKELQLEELKKICDRLHILRKQMIMAMDM